jgi:hypothetical protein
LKTLDFSLTRKSVLPKKERHFYNKKKLKKQKTEKRLGFGKQKNNIDTKFGLGIKQKKRVSKKYTQRDTTKAEWI